jgi:hypothetical protein
VTGLDFHGPPSCERSYVADGIKNYNDIANIFFPESSGAGEVGNYR